MEAIVPREAKRDWISLLAPSLLAIVVSLAIQAGAAAWYFGAMNSRLNNVEERQKLDEANRVTQTDLKDRDANRTIEKQELDIRLNRMDDKLDKIVERMPARTSH